MLTVAGVTTAQLEDPYTGEHVEKRVMSLTLDGEAVPADTSPWQHVQSGLYGRLDERLSCAEAAVREGVEPGKQFEGRSMVIEAAPELAADLWFGLMRIASSCPIDRFWLRSGSQSVGPIDNPSMHWTCGSAPAQEACEVTGVEPYVQLFVHQDGARAVAHGWVRFTNRCTSVGPCVRFYDGVLVDLLANAREHHTSGASYVISSLSSEGAPYDCRAVFAGRPDLAEACRLAGYPGEARGSDDSWIGPDGTLVPVAETAEDRRTWRAQLTASLQALGLGDGVPLLLELEADTRLDTAIPSSLTATSTSRRSPRSGGDDGGSRRGSTRRLVPRTPSSATNGSWVGDSEPAVRWHRRTRS